MNKFNQLLYVLTAANTSTSLGGRCYSEWWRWDLITLAQFQVSELSPGLFQDFMDEYIKH